MSASRRHGSKGQVLLAGVIVASLNKWTLSMARDKADVTCFGDTNKVYVQGLPDIKGTIAGVADLRTGSPSGGNAAIFDAAEGDDAVELKLVPTTLDAGNYWEGPGFLDASIDVAANGAITIASSFVAAGAWDRMAA